MLSETTPSFIQISASIVEANHTLKYFVIETTSELWMSSKLNAYFAGTTKNAGTCTAS